MELSSYLFLCVFFPLVFILYMVIPNKFKKIYLLLVSIAFGSTFSIKKMILLFILALFSFLLAKKMHRSKKILIFGILVNFLFLFLFKYIDFFIENINILLSNKLLPLNIIAPVGISYIVFQNISFLVDTYKNNSEINFNDYLLYTFYFPRLVNGPIVRYNYFEKEIRKLNRPTVSSAFDGIKRISFGMGKIFILSYILGNIWTSIFYIPSDTGMNFSVAWLGIMCYSLYLYLNFSGFIDLSIGVSKMFNITLPENFDYPYLSSSLTIFWRKWHITLGNWFRDYIYIPLGGNRKGNVYLHLFIVFLLTGLWHGSGWCFIFWGIYNGIIIIIEKIINKKKFYLKIPNNLKICITYFLIVIGWVLFACNGIKPSITYYMYMFGLRGTRVVQYDLSYFLNFYNIFFITMSFLVSFGFFYKILSKINNEKASIIVNSILIIIILALSMLFLVNNSYVPSIYANF